MVDRTTTMKRREFAVDVMWGVALALAVLLLIFLGASGPKFIYIDF